MEELVHHFCPTLQSFWRKYLYLYLWYFFVFGIFPFYRQYVFINVHEKFSFMFLNQIYLLNCKWSRVNTSHAHMHTQWSKEEVYESSELKEKFRNNPYNEISEKQVNKTDLMNLWLWYFLFWYIRSNQTFSLDGIDRKKKNNAECLAEMESSN